MHSIIRHRLKGVVRTMAAVTTAISLAVPGAATAAQAAREDLALDFEDIAHYPRPGQAVPGDFAFAPDGKLLTFLDSDPGSLEQRLYALDTASGERFQLVDTRGIGVSEDELSLEEKLRRERQRERAVGVTDYAWAEDDALLVLPLQGDIYIQRGRDGELERLVDPGEAPALDPQLSPDGTRVAYVYRDELHVIPVEGGRVRQLTHGAGEEGITHGLASYIAQEEMDRDHGFWWSRDSERIAYTEVDKRHIPVYRIVHQGKSATPPQAQENHRYPFAGKANAKVRLGVVSVDGGETQWLDTRLRPSEPDAEQESYLARVHWMPDGSLWAELENRRQTELHLVRFDLPSGERRTLLTEVTDVWINLHHMFRALADTEGEAEGGFICASEETGFRHLYLHGRHGERIRALTGGDWLVDELVGVDEEAGMVYFLASKASPLERHLYRVPLAGGDIERLTEARGMHSVTMGPDFERYVDVHSRLDQPPTVTLRSLEDGGVRATLHEPELERLAAWQAAAPEMVSLDAEDGTRLYGAMYRPDAERHGEPPYPTVVDVYGGPHVQTVQRGWELTVDMRAQHLAAQGYLVFKLDNRGSARRGLAFEGAIKHDMGHLEVRDQVRGVEWLIDRGLSDPKRVGIYGWSYGGYMSAMSLARAPEVFKVAVAGAPVTHWDGYDTHYTERYMGTPESNPEGYEASSVMHHVEDIEGDLMLVHGLIDENVHFRHTARLINALIDANKHYRLQLFPNERHMPRAEEDRVYMERRIYRFLDERL